MRKLIVCNLISLDGYYGGQGKISWSCSTIAGRSTRWTESFDAYSAQRLRAAGTLLLGRTSYDGFKSFWPPVAEDPDAQWTPIQREISRLNNPIDKVVISYSLTSAETEPWHNTRIIRRADAYQQIAELKRQTGKDILVFGSRTLKIHLQ